jgi:uncharacterized protein (TIGR03032 family)
VTRRPREELWAAHDAQWRDPAQITSQWREASDTDPALLASRARGRFWETLAERGLTLIVTREYEHLAVGLTVVEDRPRESFMPVPHPSGLAVDEARGVVYLASTRNPNQLVELEPVTALIEGGGGGGGSPPAGNPLIVTRSAFLPGSLYLHDLALVGGTLYGNAVGHNAVVAFGGGGTWRRVWWPRSIERADGPDFSRNYLQLNSIAAGATLEASFFSASAAGMSARRPGHLNFPVDGRGVIFSGATREPVATGLTRPHSARLRAGGLWVANSGYGELVRLDGENASVVSVFPGWTRGLWLGDGIAFVGSSRVIPRFRAYAPGLDVSASECGVHAVELASGAILGSLVWPAGNQIFAIEAVPASLTDGFPFTVGPRSSGASARAGALFYSFSTRRQAEGSDG